MAAGHSWPAGPYLRSAVLQYLPHPQDLTVTLTTDRSTDEIEFVKDPKEHCSLSVQSFIDEQEWKLHRYIHTWTRTREEPFKANKSKHPVFSAACKASRRPQFFIWNIFVVMVGCLFVVSSSCFVCYSREEFNHLSQQLNIFVVMVGCLFVAPGHDSFSPVAMNLTISVNS